MIKPETDKFGAPHYDREAMTPEEFSLYNIWREMRRRCHYKGHAFYHHYGARGIRVCPEWLVDLAAFAAHMGPRPTLGHSVDRIDNNKGYEPGNVRWAPQKEQCRNRRNTLIVEYKGETMCLEDAAKASGMNKLTLWYRYQRGLRGSELFAAVREHGWNSVTETIDGVTRSLSQWGKLHGIPPSTMICRYGLGWRGKDLLKPIRKMKKHTRKGINGHLQHLGHIDTAPDGAKEIALVPQNFVDTRSTPVPQTGDVPPNMQQVPSSSPEERAADVSGVPQAVHEGVAF